MREFVITIPRPPVAQPRPRARTVGGHPVIYFPKKIKTKEGKWVKAPNVEFSEMLAEVGEMHWAMLGYHEPVAKLPFGIWIEAVFKRHRYAIWKTKPMPRYRHVSKPDVDNLEKLVYDALEGKIYKNDSQVYSLGTEKWHAAFNETPHVRIGIRFEGPETERS